jgi:predicted oxidoreductase
MGMRWFPVVGWAERGGAFADGHGNSVPRFHITWGTGPGVLKPFIRRVREHEVAGIVHLAFRHRVNTIDKTNGVISGVSGDILAGDTVERGQKSNRDIVGDFRFDAANIIVTSGGIGGQSRPCPPGWPRDRLGRTAGPHDFRRSRSCRRTDDRHRP